MKILSERQNLVFSYIKGEFILADKATHLWYNLLSSVQIKSDRKEKKTDKIRFDYSCQILLTNDRDILSR